MTNEHRIFADGTTDAVLYKEDSKSEALMVRIGRDRVNEDQASQSSDDCILGGKKQDEHGDNARGAYPVHRRRLGAVKHGGFEM